MARTLAARQLARARRRLFLTSLLTLLAWCLLAAALAAAGWVVVQPWAAPDALRWPVAAGLVAVGSAFAVALAVRRAPTPVAAALALDGRFGLKERVTTSLTLTPAEEATPAGQALLADVERHLAGVRVGERFPVQPPRLPAMLLPVGLAVLVLLGLFWNPETGPAGDGDDDALAVAPAAKEDVDDKMKSLAAKPKAKKEEAKASSEELERINQEIEKFTRAPRQTREEVRDRVKDATAIEEQIRREQREQAQRVDAFKEAMKQVARLKRKNREEKQQGPASKAADAVARGDMDAAREELERLSRRLDKEEEKDRLRRKIRDPKTSEEEKKEAEEQLKKLEREDNLTQKERDELAKQLEQLEDDLKQLSRKKEEKEKQLREMAERGEIDKDELHRELDELEKMEELTEQERKEIEELAKELGECKQCLREGKAGEAAKRLQKAADKCGKCGKEGEGKELAQRLAQVRQVRRALSRSLEGGVGAGRRPDVKDDETAHKDAVVPGEWEKGKMEVIGHGPVGGFKGPRKPDEMKEEIRQAAQEAPAAIDRQRLPPAARKMARGYFEKVRGAEKDKDAKKK